MPDWNPTTDLVVSQAPSVKTRLTQNSERSLVGKDFRFREKSIYAQNSKSRQGAVQRKTGKKPEQAH